MRNCTGSFKGGDFADAWRQFGFEMYVTSHKFVTDVGGIRLLYYV